MSNATGRLVVCCGESLASRVGQTISASAGHAHVRTVPLLASCPESVRALKPAVVLIGITPADARQVFSIIEQIRADNPHLAVVLLATGGSEALAVSALRAGVADYFSEPFDEPALAASVQRLLHGAARFPAATRTDPRGSTLVGSSAQIRGVEDYLTRLAERDVTVLITGETGTGKELAASMIHARSRRRVHRFVPVNCAAIPETLLESELFGHESGAFTGATATRHGLLQTADRGTAFLDEVGDLGLVAQAKILRAIESRQVYRVGGKQPIPLDLRIVAATNVDLERAVEEGRFRKDLFYRLNVAHVHMPPLRERIGDIKALVDYYLDELNRSCGTRVRGVTADALEALQTYDWPGNIRELKNLLEAIFVCPPRAQLEMNDLPAHFLRRLERLRRLPDAERHKLLEALTASQWNKSRAAQMLKWSRMTIYRKMAKYSVNPMPTRPPALRSRRSS